MPQHEAAGVVGCGYVQELLEEVLEIFCITGLRLGSAADHDYPVFLVKKSGRSRTGRVAEGGAGRGARGGG